MSELRRYVEAETGRVGHDFFFGRTALVDGVRFWVWGIVDQGETLYVDVSEHGGRSVVSMGRGERRSVEDYVRARYARSWSSR